MLMTTRRWNRCLAMLRNAAWIEHIMDNGNSKPERSLEKSVTIPTTRYWHYTKKTTVRSDEAVMVGPESSIIWNCEYLTEAVKPFFWASSCVSFLRQLPSLSGFDKSAFCSCKKVWTCGIFSPLRTKCLEPHHHFDGRCAAHFLKAPATMCHPGNVPSKIAGFALPHLDITKDGDDV